MSNDTQELKELLGACDNALAKSESVVASKDAIIDTYRQDRALREARITELEKAQNSTETSKIIWFGLGMLATGITVHLVK